MTNDKNGTMKTPIQALDDRRRQQGDRMAMVQPLGGDKVRSYTWEEVVSFCLTPPKARKASTEHETKGCVALCNAASVQLAPSTGRCTDVANIPSPRDFRLATQS